MERVGLPELRAGVLDCPASIVHGWRDEVVPYEHSMRFAASYGAALHKQVVESLRQQF